jgi:hypothetical protein
MAKLNPRKLNGENMKRKTLSLILFAALLISACAPAAVAEEADVMVEDTAMEDESGEADGAMEGEVSFSADIWPVIEEYALNAHGGKGGIFLESYEDIAEHVVPGDPEASLLYQVLTASNGQPQMPPDGPLPDDVIQLFYDWIEQGAQNN